MRADCVLVHIHKHHLHTRTALWSALLLLRYTEVLFICLSLSPRSASVWPCSLGAAAGTCSMNAPSYTHTTKTLYKSLKLWLLPLYADVSGLVCAQSRAGTLSPYKRSADSHHQVTSGHRGSSSVLFCPRKMSTIRTRNVFILFI